RRIRGEDIHVPISSDHQDPPAVDENVVSIADALAAGDHSAAGRVEGQQPRGAAATDVKAVGGLIQRHGEVSSGFLEGPAGGDFALGKIHNLDSAPAADESAGDIDERAAAPGLELEGFGVALEANFA